ncbi:fasciclin domain-containing protein [Salisaeta longa]|uniref:fasciclin domain-containing protein n=1 Tax=Salisaeta longa TaxID=503170 RepID=UPI0003B6577B|nr:fasciclin domain-containing protein [Salisaeta longa]
MNFQRYTWHTLLALLMAVSLSACDQSSQNFEYEPGNSLSIAGPAQVVVPDTTDYYVRAFTINKSYEWTVGPAPTSIVQVRRQGEFVDVGFTEKGTYTLEVSDGEYTGTVDIAAILTDPAAQASRQGFSILVNAVTSAGLATALSGGESGLAEATVFAPRDAAFLAALDANDDDALSSDELPSAGILADILSYHVVPDSVASSAITDGATAPTVFGTELGFTVGSGGAISVEGASVVRPDIPVLGGYLHAIDEVLLPETAAVDFRDQTSTAGDSVTVAGVYLPEGGFVVMHDSTALADQGAIPSVVGASDYLEPGFHKSIAIALDQDVSDGTVLGAMPHRDTNGTETYDFVTSAGMADGPYVKNGAAVLEYGTIAVP